MNSAATVATLSIPSEYLTVEARALCERIKHKSELSDKELMMLALVASQAALARYFHPGERSAEDTLNTIGRILDHSDVVEILNRQMKLEDAPDASPIIAGP